MLDHAASISRRAEIVALVEQNGFQTIEALARHFDVTVQTIRRDLNALAADGKLSRYRGGAGLPSSIENMEYNRRRVVHLEAKLRIADMVAADIPEHASLFINIGSTTEQVARALLGHHDLSVITNNLNVARIMSESTDFRVIVAGGMVRNRDGGITGQATRDMFDRFRVDIGIIGVSGIDADGALYDFDMDEVICSQAIIRNARRVVLVTDHSKFGRPAMVRIGTLAQVSALYTDLPPPPPIAALIGTLGIELHVADPAPQPPSGSPPGSPPGSPSGSPT
ncbi:MAG TPA: DeoR family transcriptional regulator [Acidiphilium sp.]|uniref:DeoR/GlpR family DNA-binding transcription regulator n=1 Tax=unclassified Acidiphilium TaxID=2617493 RepID=UPI000BCF87B9|nr:MULTISPECIES: DeoR family transcriptional regulator [unclassified Acidiphilium]OYV54955.1 MAG: DeoR family transcriptional regulator [Acidiphilium sp. 20-67-58]HQT61668.1 DeoR family transcriptional regulator [Acidiphilium sp.]HQU10594.1 DeoR family transcriptional regulator [Acidiphilium sp.]